MPLNDPVPSTALDVAKRNASDLDNLLQQDTGTVETRTGKQLIPWQVAMQRYAAYNNTGAWVTGAAYQVNDLWESSGTWYVVLTAYTSGATAGDDIASGNVQVWQVRDFISGVDTIADLRTTEPLFDGQQVFLSDGGRSGLFNATLTDISTQVAADPLQGVYVAFDSDPTGASGGWVRAREDSDINVDWFYDSKPADISDGVESAVTIITMFQSLQPTVGTNRVLSGAVVFGGYYGAEYIVAQPQKFMPNLGSVRYVGLKYKGLNPGITIHYSSDDSDYMCYNNNQFMFTRFECLSFTANSANAMFLYSTANGGAQDMYYEDVKWEGVWNKLYVLAGANNNSEWGFSKCAVTASIADVMFESTGSDQFLNYWWSQCKLWLYKGQCIRSSAGGHYSFDQCDWSGLQPTVDSFLFELTGRVHARGVCSFKIHNGRFEHESDNSKLMYCEWNVGNVEIDANVLPALYSVNTIETVVFSPGNTQGPSVKFTGAYQGVHKYRSGSAAFNYQRTASYENVQVHGHTSINDFIVLDTTAPYNGGQWVVDCQNVTPRAAVASPSEQYVFDCSLGAKRSKGNASKKRSVSFRDANGKGTPINGGSLFIDMPAEAFITSVTWHNPANLTAVAGVTFELKDGSGAVIDSQSGQLNVAWYNENPVGHQLTQATKRLELVDSLSSATQQSEQVWVLIEYIWG